MILTLPAIPKHAEFWGSVLYFQSMSVSCRKPAITGTSEISVSSIPASSKSTVACGISDSRLAITAPAEPPPTAGSNKHGTLLCTEIIHCTTRVHTLIQVYMLHTRAVKQSCISLDSFDTYRIFTA